MKLTKWIPIDLPQDIIDKYFLWFDIAMSNSEGKILDYTEYHIDLCNWATNKSLINYNKSGKLEFKSKDLDRFTIDNISYTKFIKYKGKFYREKEDYKEFRTRGRCIFIFDSRESIDEFIDNRCTFEENNDKAQFLILGEDNKQTFKSHIKFFLDHIYRDKEDFILVLQ